ncbi:MAG: hypothetical protein ACOWWH_10225 [Eubacteriaceae bacterium]
MIKKDFNRISKISSLYISATIGAGFSSGKELFIFFTSYKEKSNSGLILSGVLFIVIGFIILDYIRTNEINTLNKLFLSLFGKKISQIVSLLIFVFLIGVFSIMISGMANILHSVLNISYYCSTVIVLFMSFLIVIYNIDGIIILSQFITPLLIGGIYIICIVLLTNNSHHVPVNSYLPNNWYISSITYISYNIIISTVVLIDAKYLITSKNISIISSFIGGFCVFSTSILINMVLNKYYFLIINQNLPMLILAKNTNDLIFISWSLILFFSMFTTALSSLIGCVNYIKDKIIIKTNYISLFIIIFTFFLTRIGFTELILIIYPLFGYIGIMFIIAVTLKYILRSRNIYY